MAFDAVLYIAAVSLFTCRYSEHKNTGLSIAYKTGIFNTSKINQPEVYARSVLSFKV